MLQWVSWLVDGYRSLFVLSNAQYKPDVDCIPHRQFRQHRGYVTQTLAAGQWSVRIRMTSLAGNGSWTKHVYFDVTKPVGQFHPQWFSDWVPGFCRATLCVSAVVRCPSVFPSLSVTFVYCIQMDDDIVRPLFQPASPIILVFWPRAPLPNSKGNPFGGGAKYTGVGLMSPFITETVRGRHRLLWNVNRSHRWRIDSSRVR